jgi:hypothetical protein
MVDHRHIVRNFQEEDCGPLDAVRQCKHLNSMANNRAAEECHFRDQIGLLRSNHGLTLNP